MNILSRGSLVSSLVLVSSVFNSVSAAKFVPVAISPRVVAHVTRATAGAESAKVAAMLLEFYGSNPEIFQNISDVYNNFRTGKIPNPNIPDDIYAKIPANVAAILCVTDAQGIHQINPVVRNTLDVVLGSIQDGLDAIKSKSCKACCVNFWSKTAPKILLMSGELLIPILTQIAASGSTVKKSEGPQSNNPIIVQVLANEIKYGEIETEGHPLL